MNSLSQIQSFLKEGNLTTVELVKHYLQRIKENQHLNAFLEVFEEDSLARAKNLDDKLHNSSHLGRQKPSGLLSETVGMAKGIGKLAGMVIGIKDNICYKNHRVSASSKILEGFVSLYNSTAVERMLEEDAIIIGRLNCDEFGMGGSNENSANEKVLNPLDNSLVPGGSSGGSAAAVAADLCLAALGSDTGGSIRQPASFCGIIGLKPTYGRVSRHGLIAYGSSFDQIGPLTKNIEDAAIILEVISGCDEYDSTASQKTVPAYSESVAFQVGTPSRKQSHWLAHPATGGIPSIGFIKESLESEGLDPEVKKRMEEIISSLKKEGHTVEPIEFPFLNYVVPVYYILTTAEASSNLARYDGIHYGYRSPNAVDLVSTYKKSRTEGFGNEVKRRIMLGTFVLSTGYYDAYYTKAQKIRRLIQKNMLDALSRHDFILLPTTPHTAFKIGQNTSDPVAMYLEDIFTVQANLAGLPAISLPLGKHTNGLPFGIQLIADKFEEEKLLGFSKWMMERYS